MIGMVVLLLTMNSVLAVGLVVLWIRSRSWCESSVDLEERLEGRMHGLESKVAELETSLQTHAPTEADWNAFIVKQRQETQGKDKGVPERYRLAVNMAANGMDLQEISEVIGISTHEARQLMSLARLSLHDGSKEE